MRRIAFAALLLVAGTLSALAASEGFTVTTCGSMPNAYTAGGFNAFAVDINGNTCIIGTITTTPATPAAGTAGAGFPPGATPITGNAAGSTGAVVGTLAAAAGKFTYVCGFNVSAVGGTASSFPIVLNGLVGAGMTYQGPINATAGELLITQTFSPCIPASAVNTAITVTTSPALGATAVNVNAWGFQQ